MKHFLCAIACILVLASCEDGPVRPPLSDNPDYFPLHIGNFWSYTVDTADSQGHYTYGYSEYWKIIGDTLFGGKKYFVMEVRGSWRESDYYYIRKEDVGTFLILSNITLTSSDDIIPPRYIYFNKPFHEYWPTYYNKAGSQSKLATKTDKTWVPIGDFFPNYVIETEADSSAFATVYGPDVGIIKVRRIKGRYSLTKSLNYAVINGVYYY